MASWSAYELYEEGVKAGVDAQRQLPSVEKILCLSSVMGMALHSCSFIVILRINPEYRLMKVITARLQKSHM